MIIREATLADITGMQIVRNAVKENTLSDPALVPDNDYIDYLTLRGKGWVAEIEQTICGFAIADLKTNNVWALFIDPEFEGKGIGKKLHTEMMNWYFSQTKTLIWLSTDAGTRASVFYQKQGWSSVGTVANGEEKFELSFENWTDRIRI
ncbi:MAG: GNAT family N-acetyltransferase [Bacteroidia bacterium]